MREHGDAVAPGRTLGLRGELALALLPTLTVLAVLGLIEALGNQRLLFASLASSAFLIYLDPQHRTNTVWTLLITHTLAIVAGLVAVAAVGPGYVGGGGAMVAVMLAMVLLNRVYPPAVSTSLGFGFGTVSGRAVALFALALAITAALSVLQRAAAGLIGRSHRPEHG